MKIIKSICIVGGGTSGWLAAAFLCHNNPQIQVTLIDKESSTPVNVGEATILNFGPFMDKCGFNVDEWFPALDATYKSGILFPDWSENNKEVWHPFFTNPMLENGVTLHDAWCKNKDFDFIKYGLPMYENSMNNRIDMNEIGAYAFHIDCGNLVKFIKNQIRDKINFIESDVVNIFQNDGNIIKLLLKNNQEVFSDLFIDCTGFKGLLKSGKRNDLSNRLFCDTAIAARIPYMDRNKELKPYVISESVDHGWIWKIPVRTRIGSGLVFNRSITPIEEAKKYFIEHWQNRISEKDLNVIDWTPFYNDNIWENNVVSIGLSAGFIEPLESTGVALIIEGLVRLQNKIADKTFSIQDSLLYNLEMKQCFENCIDFVSMHYSKSYKNTPFWKYVKNNYVASEGIKTKISLLKEGVLYTSNRKDYEIFSGANWSLWMIQLGYDVNTKIIYDKNVLKNMLLNYFNKVEKYRNNNSRDHETEITRLELYYNLQYD